MHSLYVNTKYSVQGCIILYMAEAIRFSPDHKKTLQSVLSQFGIEIPIAPQISEEFTVNGPHRFLVRGERNPDRLTQLDKRVLLPQWGEMTSYGVFFSDNFTHAFRPNPGGYFIMDTYLNPKDWLCYPSKEYIEETRKINAKFPQLNPFYVDQELYRRFHMYDIARGICTFPESISLDEDNGIVRIFLTPDFVDTSVLDSLPDLLRQKIVVLQPGGAVLDAVY